MADVPLVGSWILETQLGISGSTWKNSIGVTATPGHESTPPGDSEAIVVAWDDWMVQNHFPDTEVIQTVLRPAIQHKGPTPGMETPPIWTLAVATNGSADTTYGGAHNSNYLPKDAALFAKKLTSGGRNGKLYLRNVLTEADVGSSLSGAWSFTSHSGGFQTSVFNALVVTLLAEFMNNPPSTGNYYFSVLHLMEVKSTETRSPYATLCGGILAERPVWNTASR